MNINEIQSKNSTKYNKNNSYFTMAQIIASLIIICGAYVLKDKNPQVYSEVKSWYDYNINYKNFDMSDLKIKTQEFSDKISGSISTRILDTLRAVTS